MYLNKQAEQLKINQTELAQKAGVSQAQISRIINGTRPLTFEVANNIYKDLGYNSIIPLVLDYYGYDEIDITKTDISQKYSEEIYFTVVSHFGKKQLSSKETQLIIDNLFNG